MKRWLAALAAFIGPITKANAISRGGVILLLLAAASSAIVIGTTSISGTCSNGAFLYNNSSVVGCSAGTPGTIAIPNAVTGGVSGAIPFFSNTTTMGTSALLAANSLVVGGGAGVAPSTITTGSGVVTGIGSAVNTNGGLLTASTAAIAANAIVTGAGSGTALTGTTPGTGVLTALGTALATAANVQVGTSGAALVTPTAISGSGAIQTLTDGATISWDVSAGYNAKVTLTASGHTIANPTNVIAGLTYQLWVIQDATGSRTVSWGTAYKFGTAGAPTLTTTANAKDLITCSAFDTTPTLNCVSSLGY